MLKQQNKRESAMSGNGIHHVTAIAGPARRNLDFYTRVLGLRLVKRRSTSTIPAAIISTMATRRQPGTILTFFPWEHAAPAASASARRW